MLICWYIFSLFMGVIFRSFLALFKTQKMCLVFFTALYGKIPYHCPSSKIDTCVLSMLKMTHYMIRARFGMRATIVWSGSGVLALGCLLRCLSLDPEVRICICIHICICICMFPMGKPPSTLWRWRWCTDDGIGIDSLELKVITKINLKLREAFVCSLEISSDDTFHVFQN